MTEFQSDPTRPTWSFSQTPETFRVQEKLLYPPSGEGAHRFIHVEKRNLSTDFLKRRLSEQTGVPLSQIRHAGLKDRAATACQWLSWPLDRERNQAVDGRAFTVLEQTVHEYGLKIGQVAANHFSLSIQTEQPQKLADYLSRPRDPCPNFYGRQRFGRMADTTNWAPLVKRPKRGRNQVSVIQAGLFNAYLRDYLANQPSEPDEDTFWTNCHGKRWFQATFDDELAARVVRGEVAATGPIFGYKVPINARESSFLQRNRLETENFRAWGKSALGARRPLFIRGDNEQAEAGGGCVNWSFTLPGGVYATIYLLHALSPEILIDPLGSWPDFSA